MFDPAQKGWKAKNEKIKETNNQQAELTLFPSFLSIFH